jgi:uncharacterized membrane protein
MGTDVHPPLYFWLLHLWVLSVGLSVQSLFGLNLIFTAGCALALYLLGRTAFESPFAGLAVALTWLFSQPTFRASGEARPYELLALTTVLYCFFVARFVRRERTTTRFDELGLAVTACAGLLTHY